MKIDIKMPEGTKLTKEEINRLEYGDAMRGLGFDIVNSNKISNSEKDDLIRAVEEWLFNDGSFTQRQKSLLYRVRNEYHIRNSSLSYHCKPQSFLDKLLW